jgi:hypothetical protein
MQPDELLAEMADAETLDEISTSIYEARVWLLDHPEDVTVRSALEALMRSEREALSAA